MATWLQFSYSNCTLPARLEFLSAEYGAAVVTTNHLKTEVKTTVETSCVLIPQTMDSDQRNYRNYVAYPMLCLY